MRIAICEDVERESCHLLTLLRRYLNEQSLCADIDCFRNAETFLSAFRLRAYQIVFMDIYLDQNGINGMQAAELVHSLDTETAIIFTTNSEDFGIAGYRVAVYYILKPIRWDDLVLAMGKCRNLLDRFAKTVSFISNRRAETLRLREICYIEASRHDCMFKTRCGVLKSRMALDSLAETLESPPFVRCHRSFLVNLIHVSDLLDRDFLMKNGDKVPVSRAYYARSDKAFRAHIRAELLGSSI